MERRVYMINNRHPGLLLRDMRKSAVWIDCWGNGSDAHFHTQHVMLKIRRSVNCKRLLTRKSVSSQHNTQSFEPTGVLCKYEEELQYIVLAWLLFWECFLRFLLIPVFWWIRIPADSPQNSFFSQCTVTMCDPVKQPTSRQEWECNHINRDNSWKIQKVKILVHKSKPALMEQYHHKQTCLLRSSLTPYPLSTKCKIIILCGEAEASRWRNNRHPIFF